MENIDEILKSRLGYSEQDTVRLCGDLKQLDQSLLPLLDKWVKDSSFTDTSEYHGYSIKSLCAEYDMNFIAALLTLDWIIKEPKRATAALEGGIM